MLSKSPRIIAGLVASAVVIAGALTGCATTSTPTNDVAAKTLTLGYFDNVTHAPALVGIHEGLFSDALGETTFSTQIFNAGPAAIEALSSGAIDAAYIGPSPAINSYLKSAGGSLVVVSGATSGGAALVVRDGINSPKDLAGATLATPQLGNTQDVALRSWLADKGLATNLDGTGDVTISPSENSDTLTLFKQGEIDGAWVPEPWASRLVLEAGGHVLLNEADLWPNGEFPTTLLVVSKSYFDQYGGAVGALVAANVASIQWINDNPDKVPGAINDVLQADTGKTLKPEILDSALGNVTFTWNPIASALQTLLDHAVALDIVKPGSLSGLVQLGYLNAYLKERGLDEVSDGGLG
jgi:NitT/TauT family transport system substrate-binding protein